MQAATLLAFDYGQKRIGVAVGNTVMRHAKALAVIENRNRESRLNTIQKLIQTWQPQALVVGRPCYPDGNIHQITQQAQRFGRQLNACFNVPVIEVDERYSSVAAEANLRLQRGQKMGVDAQAACLILQQFFDEGAF